VNVKKGKLPLYMPCRHVGGDSGITPLILNIGTRCISNHIATLFTRTSLFGTGRNPQRTPLVCNSRFQRRSYKPNAARQEGRGMKFLF